MTPLETASGTTVIVNRGWIPRHFLKEQQSWEKPTGSIEVVGIPVKGESTLLDIVP
jgi:cytochrome oxidase assembly protein ShyY1